MKTVIDIAEFLKFKERQSTWKKINEAEHEYISEEERHHIEELKLNGDTVSQEEFLKELGIDEDEI
ncbi:MAG TPA: hypothetical protein DIW17_07825 [Clostridiales bacterium]|nr:hypothetical protein [Clostridiales bacterium]